MANHYVGAATSGSGNGSDWNNLCTFSSGCSSITRGDTYYLADGSYGSVNLTIPAQSGSTRVTIKKATIADHGTDTGWVDTMGDGTATFSHFGNYGANGYVTIDGQNASVGACAGVASHVTQCGIIIGDVAEGGNGTNFGSGAHDIATKYVAYTAETSNATANCIDLTDMGYEDPNATKSNITFQRCLFYGGDTQTRTHFNTTTVTWEYCEFTGTYSTNDCHGNVMYLINCTSCTFRYNYVHDWKVEGIFITYGSDPCDSSYNTTLDIYGNVFYSPTTGNSTRVFDSHSCSGADWGPINFYNNTIDWSGSDYPVALINDLGSGALYNNIVYDCNGNSLNLDSWPTHDYNWYYNCGTITETHKQTGSGDPFVNRASRDYTLSAATTAGISLSSPYDTDLAGTARGGDGTWDRGAFEYGTGGETLAITTTTLPNGGVNVPYSQTVSATGGTAPYTFSESGSNLGSGACTGLSIASNGTVSGTPTTAGTCNWTALVTDDVSATDTQALTITVDVTATVYRFRFRL